MSDSIKAKITTTSEIRAFAAQFPRTTHVFGVIVSTWRVSRARRNGTPGYWAAYTQAEWCAWVGLKSTSTLKEHLDRLEEAGLIERQRGKHMGNRVVSFIRPTATGLKLAKPRPNDWQLLGIDAPTLDPVVEIEAVFAAAYLAKQGTPLKVLSKVEKKALADIMQTLPADGVSVVDRCVREWGSFIVHVGNAAGIPADKLPKQPSAKFIRLHLQSACDFAAEQTAKQKKPAPVPSLEPVPSVQLISQTETEEPKPKTLDELMSIINSSDEGEEAGSH